MILLCGWGHRGTQSSYLPEIMSIFPPSTASPNSFLEIPGRNYVLASWECLLGSSVAGFEGIVWLFCFPGSSKIGWRFCGHPGSRNSPSGFKSRDGNECSINGQDTWCSIYHKGYHLLHGGGTLMSGGSLESAEPSPHSFLNSMAGNNVYPILFSGAWICLWLPPLFFLESPLFGTNCPTSSPLCSYGQRVCTLGGNSRSINTQGESQGHVLRGSHWSCRVTRLQGTR